MDRAGKIVPTERLVVPGAITIDCSKKSLRIFQKYIQNMLGAAIESDYSGQAKLNWFNVLGNIIPDKCLYLYSSS